MTEERKDYPVLSPVKRDGKRIEPGGSVSLTVAEFDALKLLGAVGEALTPEQVAEARAASISAFVMTLTIADMGKKNALTETGRAKAEAALGFVPDADELRQGLETWAKARDAKDAEAERAKE